MDRESCGSKSRPHICHFFSTNVLFGLNFSRNFPKFLHMTIFSHKYNLWYLWQIWALFSRESTWGVLSLPEERTSAPLFQLSMSYHLLKGCWLKLRSFKSLVIKVESFQNACWLKLKSCIRLLIKLKSKTIWMRNQFNDSPFRID